MPDHNEVIPVAVPAFDASPLRFSFKYLDFENPRFRPQDCCLAYFLQLFSTLRRFSTWTVADFIDQNNTEHRHIIDFEQTVEKDGFQHIPAIDVEQLGSLEGWQFSVCLEDRASRWRAHGTLADDTFYVIWLDEHHRLFP